MIANLPDALLSRKATILPILALAAATLALAACGGGSAMQSAVSPEPPEVPGDGPEPDAPLARLADILDRADTLLVGSLHSRWSLAGGGEALIGASADALACSGARCVAADGTAITVQDMLDLDAGAGEADLGSRGGFDTAATRDAFAATESAAGVTVSGLTVLGYGFWGEHGFAALELGSGSLADDAGETAFGGDFTQARAYALGEVSGFNPAGTGSATWRGLAEASPTGAFERLRGTATVTIADLSRPRVGVAIDVPGHAIGAPGWADMALAGGGFASGTAGRDHLAGHFHGPDHDEAWGVFDTATYLGAFGAKRER